MAGFRIMVEEHQAAPTSDWGEMATSSTDRAQTSDSGPMAIVSRDRARERKRRQRARATTEEKEMGKNYVRILARMHSTKWTHGCLSSVLQCSLYNAR